MSGKPGSLPRSYGGEIGNTFTEIVAAYPAAAAAVGVPKAIEAKLITLIDITTGAALVKNTDYEYVAGVLTAKGATYTGDPVAVQYIA